MPINLTQEGFDKLQSELKYLKTTRRLEVADMIETARLKGDLRENAEYDAAKETQAHLERRIADLENTLGQARIINEEEMDASKAFVGATLTLKNLTQNLEIRYKLVSEAEANFKEKKISTDSPIGSALMGKEVGDVVEIQVPAGQLKLEILKIERI